MINLPFVCKPKAIPVGFCFVEKKAPFKITWIFLLELDLPWESFQNWVRVFLLTLILPVLLPVCFPVSFLKEALLISITVINYLRIVGVGDIISVILWYTCIPWVCTIVWNSEGIESAWVFATVFCKSFRVNPTGSKLKPQIATNIFWTYILLLSCKI